MHLFEVTGHAHMWSWQILKIKGCCCRYWDGVYVLYTFSAQRRVSQAVQKLLSTPVVGDKKNVLRHMTFII